MNVLLIVPTAGYNNRYPSFLSLTDFPAGFAFLASALRNAGHEVFGLNPNNDPNYWSAYDMIHDKICRSLQEVRPDLIGLGGLCTDYAFIKDAIQIIRKLAPNVPIVCGGGIITYDAEYIFKLFRPDFCIIGEGEEMIVKLANTLESGKQGYGQIPNLGYWEDGIAKFTNQDFNYGDINQRHFPDYEPFGIREMLDDYSMAARLLYRYTRPYPRPMVMVTARSCPFNCTFCVHQRGAKYRARSVENIIQEIKVMYERYGFNILIVLDELFAVNKTRMREFCTTLIGARQTYGWDFDWMFQTHASAALDRNTLELAKKAGCYFFSYGLESASPRVLESMKKKTKPSQIADAIHLADEVGLGFGGNFIFGDPVETEDTILETIDFLVRYCLDIHVLLDAVRPYPGSKLFETCLARGIIRDKLEFYEHIDEHPWNMTSMRDKVWLPLVDSIVSFGGLFPWVKSVYPSHYEVDSEASQSPLVLCTGKQIYKIWTKCPHCGEDIYSRELLALGEVRKSEVIRKSGVAREAKHPSSIKQFITTAQLTKQAVGKAARLASLYYLSFRNPIYRLLKSSVRNRKHDLFVDSFFTTVFFVTGCPHCSRRIKINIPIKALSFIEIKRRLRLA